MQKKPWFLLALAALALNTGAAFAGDDNDDKEGKEISSSEDTITEQPASADCGCSD